MQYEVKGANRDTGKPVTITVEAASPADAQEQANELGILVSDVDVREKAEVVRRVEAAPASVQPAARPSLRDVKRCTSCKELIRKDATKCPHCRADQPETPAQLLAAGGILAVLVVVVLVAWYSCTSGPSAMEAHLKGQRDWERSQERIDRGNPSMAYIMAQDFVKVRLVAPGSAKWPGTFERDGHARPLGGGRYEIRSWVDSHNAFGALVRTRYVAVVVDEGADRWKLESLELFE